MNAAGEACPHDLRESVQGLALGGVEENRFGVAEVLAADGLDEGLGDQLHDQLGGPVVWLHFRLPIFLPYKPKYIFKDPQFSAGLWILFHFYGSDPA